MSTDGEYILVYDKQSYYEPTPMERDINYLKEKHGGEFSFIDSFSIHWEKPKYTLPDCDIEALLADQVLERRTCELWKIIK